MQIDWIRLLQPPHTHTLNLLEMHTIQHTLVGRGLNSRDAYKQYQYRHETIDRYITDVEKTQL